MCNLKCVVQWCVEMADRFASDMCLSASEQQLVCIGECVRGARVEWNDANSCRRRRAA